MKIVDKLIYYKSCVFCAIAAKIEADSYVFLNVCICMERENEVMKVTPRKIFSEVVSFTFHSV